MKKLFVLFALMFALAGVAPCYADGFSPDAEAAVVVAPSPAPVVAPTGKPVHKAHAKPAPKASPSPKALKAVDHEHSKPELAKKKVTLN